MNIELIKELLDKVYANSKDSHNIYTPLELCEEMINSLSDLSGDILVISNLEFLIVLKSKIGLDKVHYTTSCDIKKQVAISLGINVNNIYDLEYNNKEINLGIEEMKFDVIIQNPPYNPNNLWKNFVEKGISLLKDDGQMLAIHPEIYRIEKRYDNFLLSLIKGLKELHILKSGVFGKSVGVSVDWYLYSKQNQKNFNIYYHNKNTEILKNTEIDRIFEFDTKSIQNSILNKITKKNYHNGFKSCCLSNTEFYDNNELGVYKQCGGKKNGTGWTTGKFNLTLNPTKYQFEDKVVMSYVRQPRAKYFSKEDAVGVVVAFYWLTNNKSLPILLNSKMIWKLHLEIVSYNTGAKNINAWFLSSLNFDNLNVQTEEELYAHYNLTQEEINWIKNV